jgi:VanZ family protein
MLMRLLLRHPWFWLGLGWALIIAAVIVSLLPGQSLPQTGVSDKVEHTVAYMLLTLWFTGVYPRSSYFKIGLGMFLLGVAIEIAQGAMPFGREADIRDVVANSLGIALGIGVAWMGIGGWAQRIEAWARKW